MTESGKDGLFITFRPGTTAEELKNRFPPPVYFTAVIDGAAAQGKAALMEALAAAFRFPPYFGKNWDALADCLRSLPDSLPAKSYVLVVNNSEMFLARSEADRKDFAETALAAGEFLQEKFKIQFRVALL